MIEVLGIKKIFYAKKNKKITAINNISINFPDKGIVTILGPSGCGKTTLLNIIGGLDLPDEGDVIIDNISMKRSGTKKRDTIRNEKIGYIFQNYNLIESKTIYENIVLALQLIGLTDKDVINKRVNYSLEKVGLYKERNKLPVFLSGGQCQRVAIARAIAKNPDIILADEPTGNLDDINAIEIMNILEKISKDKLVIMVTHNRKISEAYADKVIEIRQGNIEKEYVNKNKNIYGYDIDNCIYLKDMSVKHFSDNGKLDIEFFSNFKDSVKIKLIQDGKNLYFDSDMKYNLYNADENIKIIDDYREASSKNMYKTVDFDYEAFIPNNFQKSYQSIYNRSNIIKDGIREIKKYSKLKKITLLSYLFIAVCMFISLSSILGVLYVDEAEYLSLNDHYLTISNYTDDEKMRSLLSDIPDIKYTIPGDSKARVLLPLDDYYQSTNLNTHLDVSIVDLSVLNAKELAYGRFPRNNREIVIDEMCINRCIKNGDTRTIGINGIKDFLNRRINVGYAGDYVIVGIVNQHSPSMYVATNQILTILTNCLDQKGELEDVDDTYDFYYSQNEVVAYDLFDDINIIKGREPQKDYEVLVSEDYIDDYSIGQDIPIRMADKKLKVVGFYKNNSMNLLYYVKSSTIIKDYIFKNKIYSVYVEDIDDVSQLLSDRGLSVKKTSDFDKMNYVNKMFNVTKSSLAVAISILLISIIQMFLIMRSSLMARMKEVAVLRAIAVKRGDICRMFRGEIFVSTILTAIPGILVTYYILENIIKISDYLSSVYTVSPLLAIATLLLVIIINQFIGMLPIYNVVRKSPANLLARTDIE